MAKGIVIALFMFFLFADQFSGLIQWDTTFETRKLSDNLGHHGRPATATNEKRRLKNEPHHQLSATMYDGEGTLQYVCNYRPG